jgi:hypothetical protein
LINKNSKTMSYNSQNRIIRIDGLGGNGAYDYAESDFRLRRKAVIVVPDKAHQVELLNPGQFITLERKAFAAGASLVSANHMGRQKNVTRSALKASYADMINYNWITKSYALYKSLLSLTLFFTALTGCMNGNPSEMNVAAATADRATINMPHAQEAREEKNENGFRCYWMENRSGRFDGVHAEKGGL